MTTWMLTFAGVASAAGLLGLTAIGLLVGCLDTVEARLLLGALVAAAAAMVTLFAAESWRARTITVVAMAIGRIETVALRVAGEPRDRTVDYSRSDLVARLRSVRLGKWHGACAVTAAGGNWALDWLTLMASLAAVGVPLTPGPTLLAYGTVQLLGTASLVPGNLGLAEGGLTVALVTAGVPAGTALAGVLLYRLISYWLLLPLGWCAWFILRGPLRTFVELGASGRPGLTPAGRTEPSPG